MAETTSESAKAAKPAVAPQLDRLKQWEGTWTSVETYEPNEFLPQGGSGTGACVIRLGPAGILIENYDSKGAPFGDFTAHHVLTWNEKEKVYTSYWFDSLQPKGMIATGRFEGDTLSLTGTALTHDGKNATYRATWSNIDANARFFTMEESVEGGPMKKMFTMEYRRATTH